jgi:hypothetical protein
MSVLGKPSTTVDAIPDSAKGMLSHFNPPAGSGVSVSLDPGALETSSSHRLLTGLGKNNGEIYAIPTDKGNVCFIFTGGPNGGCVPAFGGDVPVPNVISDPDQYWSGTPTEVLGLAPDSVIEIDVVVNGQEHRAQLANNAYFYELSDAAEYPTGLVVSYRDGTYAKMDLAVAPPQQ